MTNLEKLRYLNDTLLDEMPQYKEQAARFKQDYYEGRRLLRSLMNVRPPMPINAHFLKIQDEFLQSEVASGRTISMGELRPLKSDSRLYLWQGDITTLKVDAIVNAANSALLGCFIPCHDCIDNAIHSVAGIELRRDCDEIIRLQGHEERTGTAKITKGYNLPSKYVLHTVGPIVDHRLTEEHCSLLADCYRNCLELAIEHKLSSVAFCCISTGEFRFPNKEAASIAVDTVKEVLNRTGSEIGVIFNVFKEQDLKLYRELLGQDL